MLQPARCRRLIRTQPISYPPDSGDDTRLPWRFYDGFASRVTGTRIVELKSMGESLQVWPAGHITPQPNEITEITCASIWFPTSSRREHAQIHAPRVLRS